MEVCVVAGRGRGGTEEGELRSLAEGLGNERDEGKRIGEGNVMEKQRSERCTLRSEGGARGKEASSPSAWKRQGNAFSPRPSKRNVVLPTPRF